MFLTFVWYFKTFPFRQILHMWTLVHPLDIRRITETIQDILWLLRYLKMTSVEHPWDKICCVGYIRMAKFEHKFIHSFPHST